MKLFNIQNQVASTMVFKDIESVQQFVKVKLDDFEERIDKSTFPENESYEANITIKITFTKGMYKVVDDKFKTKHKRTERNQSQE